MVLLSGPAEVEGPESRGQHGVDHENQVLGNRLRKMLT